MSGVISFTGLYYGDEPANDVLEKAKSWNAEAVFIIGQDKDGKLSVGGNVSDMKDMLWLLYRAQWWLSRQEEVLGN